MEWVGGLIKELGFPIFVASYLLFKYDKNISAVNESINTVAVSLSGIAASLNTLLEVLTQE